MRAVRTHVTVYLQLNHIVARPDLLTTRRVDFNPRVSAARCRDAETGKESTYNIRVKGLSRVNGGPRTFKRTSLFR